MSDGEAGYPTDAVRKLNSSLTIRGKMSFKSIAYGEDAHIDDVLKPLAKDLGGEFVSALEPSHLMNAFISLIPHVYRAKGQK